MVKTFFPKGNWIDLDTLEGVNVTSKNGEEVELKPRSAIIKHLRPGYSIFVQNDLPSGQISSKILESSPISLMVNLDDSFYSQGSISMSNITVTVQTTLSSISSASHASPILSLSSIKIFGHMFASNGSSTQQMFACLAGNDTGPFASPENLSIRVDKKQ